MTTAITLNDGLAVATPGASVLTYSGLKERVAHFLGWGRTSTNWTAAQVADLNDIVLRGMRRFYVPPILRGEKYSHDWSFLRPIYQIETAADDYIYDLPANFTMFDGPLTFEPGQSVLYAPIDIVSEHQIRIAQQDGTTTGRPRKAATRVKTKTPATAETTYEILFWPIPDDAYTIECRYRVNPTALNSDTDVPYGGEQHYDTIIESCLAVAEATMNDTMGLHKAEFLERLAASVAFDRKQNCPPTLGRNRDTSEADELVSWHDLDANIVTYNGVAY